VYIHFMLGLMITLFQARIERIEQLENELNLSESVRLPHIIS